METGASARTQPRWHWDRGSGEEDAAGEGGNMGEHRRTQAYRVARRTGQSRIQIGNATSFQAIVLAGSIARLSRPYPEGALVHFACREHPATFSRGASQQPARGLRICGWRPSRRVSSDGESHRHCSGIVATVIQEEMLPAGSWRTADSK
ncbi:hypothetical protein SCLCIDRAFT_23262 [Scleroderma citrinum Foug A]|uniref:Uncharacterized protein n=1 Tax=Scleroderma citrinum Foug A TaxID=1036808 RepID=A0A0C3AJ24_9AGAM|nr:hypothetical protein SCLCIDRAFT_23262 [Scleroderma citrinum Foug A]